jgi:ABC-2 type transport system ATP-binding protein
MIEKAIEIKSVTKRFGELTAVSNLSLSVPSGSIYGILGPNGAGKTTTIRMIMNIFAPDEGEIEIFGEKMGEETKNIIGYLPEERGLYPKMQTLELLVYFGELKGMEKKEAERRGIELLRRIGLYDWKNRKIEELSKGMQQKVQFIATIIHDPKIVILDEPFSGLDPLNTEVLKELMMELKKEGKTILFSTHLMEHAEKLCDYVALINKGKKVLDGSLSEIKRDFGRNIISIEIEGDGSPLYQIPSIIDRYEFGNRIELEMKEGEDPYELLKEIMERVKVKKFEISEASLNHIFIKVVKGS